MSVQNKLLKYVLTFLLLSLISCENNTKQLDYYRSQSEITNPGQFKSLYNSIPDSLEQIVKLLQGLMVHTAWIKSYDKQVIIDTNNFGFTIRRVEEILQKINKIDSNSLKIERHLEKKLLVNCRTFTVMLCSILRHKNIPARVRVGYATYFHENYENHWICEYWNYEKSCWTQVDTQIDSLQKSIKNIRFNSLDIPYGAFITAGEAWKLCRSGNLSPEKIGVTGKDTFINFGYKMLIQDVFCDFRSLNKLELLPWDNNIIWDKDYENLTEKEILYLDSIVEMIADESFNLKALRQTYKNDKRTRMPDNWNY